MEPQILEQKDKQNGKQICGKIPKLMILRFLMTYFLLIKLANI